MFGSYQLRMGLILMIILSFSQLLGLCTALDGLLAFIYMDVSIYIQQYQNLTSLLFFSRIACFATLSIYLFSFYVEFLHFLLILYLISILQSILFYSRCFYFPFSLESFDDQIFVCLDVTLSGQSSNGLLIVQNYIKLMKYLTILALIAVTALSVSLTHLNSHNQIVGGFTAGQPVADQKNLDSQHARINLFIRNNIPDVNGLKLYSYRDQVVAGINYCFTYGSATQPGTQRVEICAWSKPWENNFLQVKKPDGGVVKVGGLDAMPANSISTTITKLP